jgi:hypothetical protein
VPVQEPGPFRRSTHRVARFARRTWALAWAAFVALAVTQFSGPLWDAAFGEPAPIHEQLANVRQQAAADSLRTVANRRVDFHGTGQASYLLALRRDDTPWAAGPNGKLLRVSDEIRIYDVEDHELVLRFRFRPKPDRGLAYLFELLSVGDLDRNGRVELVGSYWSVYMNERQATPVALVWDDATSAYKLSGLITTRPQLRFAKRPGYWERILRQDYADPDRLHDPRSGITTRSYVAEFVTLVQEPSSGPFLLAAYIVRQRAHIWPATYQLTAWRLDFQKPTAASTGCFPPPADLPLVSEGRHRQLHPNTFVRAWQSRRGLLSC